ncbi:hypothetical protein Tco_0490586 [Tanacetum coccineum]
MSASMEARIAEHAAAPTPPLPVAALPLPLPSPLTTSPTDARAPLGYRAAGIWMRAASPPLLLPSTSYKTNIPEAEMSPRKRACLTTPAPRLEIGESSAAGATRQPRDRVMETGYGITDTWDEIVEAMLEVAPTTLEGVNQRVTKLATTVRQENKEFQVRLEDAQDGRAYLRARVNILFRDRPYHRHTAMILDREAMYACITWTSSEDKSAANKGPMELIERGVAAMLAKCDADRSKNGDDSHDSGTGERRQVSNVRECTYTDFLKCQPMNFKGTEGVVRLTQWLKKMESVFHISNCTIECQAVRHDTAYAMPWKTLKKMITDKYCPRSEIKKLETEIMFLEESDVVENYVSGLPNMIHRSVKASKPKTMQVAIEFATEMMNKKILTIAERQAKNKRKFDDTSRNNQNQQQSFKRNNVARAYTIGPGEKKNRKEVINLCAPKDYHQARTMCS